MAGKGGKAKAATRRAKGAAADALAHDAAPATKPKRPAQGAATPAAAHGDASAVKPKRRRPAGGASAGDAKASRESTVARRERGGKPASDRSAADALSAQPPAPAVAATHADAAYGAPVVDGSVQVVWLKRDLRVHDHAALCAAAAAGPVVVLYVFEPPLLAAETADRRQWDFVHGSLAELGRALRARGAWLTVRVGDVVPILAQLDDDLRGLGGIAHVHSHQETGDAWTFARDRAVGAFLGERGIPWSEHAQDGVVRRLPTRDGWSRRWEERMSAPLLPAPAALRAVPATLVPPGELPDLDALAVPALGPFEAQPAGEAAGRATLQSFLCERGEPYQAAMSSPLFGWDACSRLSPHFAYGTVSLRTAHHALLARQDEVRALNPAQRGGWLKSLRSFAGRLRWHCHFMQKLEDEPAIEFHNMNRAFDGLREGEFDAARFAAWAEGRTGYPMVDACMRCLRATGWLNFRMRAMLVSFAAYHLWLHWRPVGVHLARCFVDYEPGIHWSQSQMQSGVTGINTVRIYSPQKQLRDQDPEGVFVRRWVPELARVPLAKLAEPHTMTADEQAAAGCRIGVDYPAPIVDAAAAVAAAKQRIYGARRTPDARAESARVFAQHGSRKRQPRRHERLRRQQADA
jgi:deoxyribodipyrimidine photo-lyase